MQRIVVIGCPGSGKSFFSKKLADKINLPLIHLDMVYHDLSYDYYDNKVDWENRMRKLVSGQRWIVEGNYKSSFEIRFKAADTIILLDYPPRIYIKRIFKRRIEYRNKQRFEMPETWKEKLEFDFILFVLRYKRIERPKVLKLLEKYEKSKTIILLHSDQEADDFIDKLSLKHIQGKSPS